MLTHNLVLNICMFVLMCVYHSRTYSSVLNGIILSILFCLSSIGVVFAFVSNDKVNDSIQNFDTTVNAALNSSINFIDDTQMVGHVVY